MWYMMYTYTAAAADILYVVRVCAVPQMRIEYPQGGGLGLGGEGLRSGMESLYRFAFTRGVYRVKVCLIIGVISGYIRVSSS